VEHSVETVIGDEIEVTVYFDYDPGQIQTYWQPGFKADVIINAVCVDDNQNKDIEDVLSHETLASLQITCFEHMEVINEP